MAGEYTLLLVTDDYQTDPRDKVISLPVFVTKVASVVRELYLLVLLVPNKP